MVPLVAIEVPVGEPPAAVATMLEACSSALAEGRCVAADAETQTPTALAVVSWLGKDHLTARVEVGQRASSRSSVSWHRRDLNFASGDSISERWTAVGYTIATIVGEIAEGAASIDATRKQSSAEPERSSEPSQAPIARAQSRTSSRWLALGPLGLLDAERAHLGGSLAAGAPLAGSLGVEFTVSYIGSTRDDRGLAVSRWSFAGYLGLVGEDGQLFWRLLLGPVLERVGADVSRGQDADSGARWLPGISARISGGYAPSERVDLTLTAGAEQLSGATELRVEGRGVSRIPAQALTLGLSVGTRF
ncbi:MAG: hypothetical protein R3B07_13220 [Polyangiaceae bacterium]